MSLIKYILIGYFCFNGPLSLYRAVSQRGRKKRNDRQEKNVQQPQPAPTGSAVGPCAIVIQSSRTPRHWKFTQNHRTTRPTPSKIHFFTLFLVQSYVLAMK